MIKNGDDAQQRTAATALGLLGAEEFINDKLIRSSDLNIQGAGVRALMVMHKVDQVLEVLEENFSEGKNVKKNVKIWRDEMEDKLFEE
ncbi:MAG: hypothetical protein ABIE74_05385 [Pseudomonadota bacterium]